MIFIPKKLKERKISMLSHHQWIFSLSSSWFIGHYKYTQSSRYKRHEKENNDSLISSLLFFFPIRHSEKKQWSDLRVHWFFAIFRQRLNRHVNINAILWMIHNQQKSDKKRWYTYDDQNENSINIAKKKSRLMIDDNVFLWEKKNLIAMLIRLLIY